MAQLKKSSTIALPGPSRREKAMEDPALAEEQLERLDINVKSSA